MTSAFVAASWAMIPPARVSDPTSVSGLPIARMWNGSRNRKPSTSSDPGAPLTAVRATIRMSSIAIASAPALRSSFRRSSTAVESIAPVTVIVTPFPATGSSPAQALIRASSAWICSTDEAPIA